MSIRDTKNKEKLDMQDLNRQNNEAEQREEKLLEENVCKEVEIMTETNDKPLILQTDEVSTDSIKVVIQKRIDNIYKEIDSHKNAIPILKKEVKKMQKIRDNL